MIDIAIMPATGWRKDGSCQGVDNGWFFDEDEDAATNALAKALCNDCPVRNSCLSYALVTDERVGIWGGTEEKERWALSAKVHGASRLASRGCTCSPCKDTRKLRRNAQATAV